MAVPRRPTFPKSAFTLEGMEIVEGFSAVSIHHEGREG